MMEIDWPQGIYLGVTVFGTGIVLAKHGEPKTGRYNILTTLITDGLILGLLWWGGFFA